MAGVKTIYYGQPEPFYCNVCFIVKATGEKLVKSFESDYMAQKFANKLRHSKKCTLVSRYSGFSSAF